MKKNLSIVTMAQKLYSSQIPDSFRGLLSNSKVVQDLILERTEKKISLLEGRPSISLYSKTGSPPSLNSELDISSPNFIALSESFFIVKMRYTVKDNLNANPGDYKNWICPTSPAFSWFKNVRVELDGIFFFFFFLLKSRLQSHFVVVNCGVFWW